MTELEEIVYKLSLTVDDYGEVQGTHYIENADPLPRIRPKGSFIALVERAKRAVEEMEARGIV